jgi:hypothetical protein
MSAETSPARRCFVISPIGADGSAVRQHADDVFDYIIKPAVAECGLVAHRSDHLLEPGKISAQMFREILTGDCCVALLTGHNPNVFYELAVAHTAGTPVVALIEKGEALPFDLHDWRCVRYDLSPRPLFEGTYVKELVAHLSRLALAGWVARPLFGDLAGGRLTRGGLPAGLVAELTADWAEKRAALSDFMRQLLGVVERAARSPRHSAGQRDLTAVTGKAHDDKEIYYRMETLRLLGFVEKSRDQTDATFRYTLSPGYRSAWGAASSAVQPARDSAAAD